MSSQKINQFASVRVGGGVSALLVESSIAETHIPQGLISETHWSDGAPVDEPKLEVGSLATLPEAASEKNTESAIPVR